MRKGKPLASRGLHGVPRTDLCRGGIGPHARWTQSTCDGVAERLTQGEGAKARFLEEVHKSATFLRTLPGFVEGYVYEKTDGESRHNVVTTAVWKDEEAFQNAKKNAAEGLKNIGFNPPEIMKKLNVQIERAMYRRLSY